jgi:hypothetical protein
MGTRIGRCLPNQIGDPKQHIGRTVWYDSPSQTGQPGITGLETAIKLIAFLITFTDNP